MQNPPKPRRLQHVFPGQSFLIIFVRVLHSPHRRCAFRIVSTTLVYSQCHLVPCIPCGDAANAWKLGREPCYVVWRVGFNFDGSHAVASSTPARIPASLPRLCGHPTSVSGTGRRRCPEEIEDQEHEQVLTSERPAIVCERDRREHLRMDLAADPH
jgi:hypothetical protein